MTKYKNALGHKKDDSLYKLTFLKNSWGFLFSGVYFCPVYMDAFVATSIKISERRKRNQNLIKLEVPKSSHVTLWKSLRSTWGERNNS